MFEAILGLTIGVIVVVICCLAVHKMVKYGKKEGIVQDDEV